MHNGLERAEFWRDFIVNRCEYPSPDLLRAQLAEAVLDAFCDCGCNSFAVHVPEGVPPLFKPLENPKKGYGVLHEADFMMADGRTLEVILFADDCGRLVFVEIDCCANSYPVPEHISVAAKPFRVRSTINLDAE